MVPPRRPRRRTLCLDHATLDCRETHLLRWFPDEALIWFVWCIPESRGNWGILVNSGKVEMLGVCRGNFGNLDTPSSLTKFGEIRKIWSCSICRFGRSLERRCTSLAKIDQHLRPGTSGPVGSFGGFAELWNCGNLGSLGDFGEYGAFRACGKYWVFGESGEIWELGGVGDVWDMLRKVAFVVRREGRELDGGAAMGRSSGARAPRCPRGPSPTAATRARALLGPPGRAALRPWGLCSSWSKKMAEATSTEWSGGCTESVLAPAACGAARGLAAGARRALRPARRIWRMGRRFRARNDIDLRH